MAINPDFGKRLREARRDWEKSRDRDLSNREIGEALGKALRRTPFTAQTVSAWFVKGQEPESLAVVGALATLLGVTSDWLAFGGATPAPTTTADLNARTATRPPSAPPTTTKAAPGKAANDKRKGR